MALVKVGQEITLVSKGIIHSSYGNDWIDSTLVGRTHFLKVTKVGNKYIYGKGVYFEDGQRKEVMWESKENLSDYVVFEGIRRDLEAQYREFRDSLNTYEERRKQTQYQFDRELNEQLRAKITKWDEENPRPQPLKIN